MPELPNTQPGGHVYVFVRTDLPLADQMVQIAHVCLEAGQRFCIPGGSRLVLLQVADEPALLRARQHCRRHAIPMHTFTEPDATDELPHVPMGQTTACTSALDAGQRHCLRRFPLWKNESKGWSEQQK